MRSMFQIDAFRGQRRMTSPCDKKAMEHPPTGWKRLKPESGRSDPATPTSPTLFEEVVGWLILIAVALGVFRFLLRR